MKLATFVFVLAATSAFADDLPLPVPALYDVSGVAADDTLNVRALPDASSDIVGELASDATAVEVVAYSRSSEWGLVNAGEGSGWVSMQFLQDSSVMAGAYGLPAFLHCSGTEPFFGVMVTQDGLMVTTPDTIDDPKVYPIEAVYPSGPEVIDLSNDVLISWLKDGQSNQARILPGKCSDGMSDRQYGLHYSDPVLGTGCCSIAP